MADHDQKKDIENDFYLAVDNVLNYVQGLSDDMPRQQLSAVILYAAARYNSYNWIFRDGNEEQLPEEAAQWFADQYQKMFEENSESLMDAFKQQGVL